MPAGLRAGRPVASRVEGGLAVELAKCMPKPPDSARREAKQNYGQNVSNAVALAFAEELRQRGMAGALPLPAPPVKVRGAASGAERRLAGGIGPKKVDVSWVTEESGLLLGISVKTISFRDNTTKNYQKNLTNRRGDMLFESITLHRRFPYSVLCGFLFLDAGASSDETAKRRSTFINAHARLELFTGRTDPAGRDEQYEHLYIVLLDASVSPPQSECYPVGDSKTPVKLWAAFDEMVELVARRNADFYEAVGGDLQKVN